jgi:translation initiation factor IF-3
VRVIGADGDQVGLLELERALAYAWDRDLDLVELDPHSDPPVCRCMDYSKYRYEQQQKQRRDRKNQTLRTVKEIKFRPKVAEHDYQTKRNHIVRFLAAGDHVKVTIMFRGRERTHPELGRALLERLVAELAEQAILEQAPSAQGATITMLLAPATP